MHFAELRAVREELTGPGGQFEIAEADVLGQRLRVFKNAPPSVREFWLSTVAWGDRPYLIYEGEVLTYAQAHAHAAPEKARKCRAPGARRCRQAYPTVVPSRTSTTTIRSR